MRKREERDVKKSGYVWLGEIPNNWKIVDFKYLFNICKQVSTEKDPVVLSLGMSGIKIRDTSNNEGQLAASYENYALIKKGQFALNPMDLISGAVAISPYEGVMSNAYKIFTQEGSQYGIMMNPEYYEYLLRYHYDNKVFLPFGKGVGRSESGGGRWTLNAETLNNFPMLLPPLEEQQRIAAFLDAETGKVDNLVDELTKFKGQLQTQRKSLISECVTKGVPEDRDRAYKDSGLDYLALEMPLSWERMKLKNVLSKTTSGATPSSGDDSYYTDDDNAMPWVAIGDMDDNVTTYTKNKVTEKALKECRLTVIPSGTLIYSMYASVGFVSELGMDATTNQAILALYLKDSVNKSFIKYWLKNMRYYVDRLTSVSTQANLNANKVLNLDLFVPSIAEQQKIANYLDTECAKIDSLISEIDIQIVLLKTYRKSLINEVVTGKVEV